MGLSTFIDDISAVIRSEELDNVVLVGHSFGGHVINGVADRMPQLLRQLIYLDGLVVQHGQSALSIMPPAVQAERIRTLDAEGLRMVIPSPDQFGLSDPEQVAWVMRHLTPHPLKGYAEPLHLQHPVMMPK